MSDRRTEPAEIRQHLSDAEKTIIDLNRQLTEAIVAKRSTGGLSTELDAIIEARNAMRARLTRFAERANDN